MRAGFIAIARTTFDIPFAAAKAQAAFSAISASPLEVIGSPRLATTVEEVDASMSGLSDGGLDAIVVFQATFADSTLIAGVTDRAGVPLILWATPEERTGGRLRLNSFCGINLAGYVLARSGADYRWVYADPDSGDAAEAVLAAIHEPPELVDVERVEPGEGPAIDLSQRVVGVVGRRPDGFEPCDYDPGELKDRFGLEVQPTSLEDWFGAAEEADQAAVEEVRSELSSAMEGLEDVDGESLTRSLRLYLGLSSLIEENGWSGVATRCWPECFTEYGGAACAGNSLVTSSGTPGCCEADVYGNLTALLLQEASGAAPLVADLIDFEATSNTAVFWHCGLAPKEMLGPGERARATIHSNRKQPLLNEFALKPGTVTIARVSQARNTLSLVVGLGEMLEAPLPFSGTSGVCRLDSPVEDALDTIMGAGLEHHYGIVYGDHRPDLYRFAARHDLGVVTI